MQTLAFTMVTFFAIYLIGGYIMNRNAMKKIMLPDPLQVKISSTGSISYEIPLTDVDIMYLVIKTFIRNCKTDAQLQDAKIIIADYVKVFGHNQYYLNLQYDMLDKVEKILYKNK